MKKTLSKIIALACVAFVLCTMLACFVGCNEEDDDYPGPKWNENAEVYINPINDDYRVFYQIFVGSFSDSNGDGIGDLRGIINRIDYLNDGKLNSGKSLGVQGIWLSPIFTSPTYHKYDATSYYSIDSQYGTEQDLVELLQLCHERNVKVILDLAINHTSTQSAWFTQFVNAHKSGDTENKYYEYYSYYTSLTPEDKTSGCLYATIPGVSGEYYECNFDTGMPELNFNNDDVKEEVLNVAKHYLDMGVDGFRFDAIKYIYYQNTSKTVDFWNWYMGELKAYKSDIYCVGECWESDVVALEYIEALNCFNFTMSQGEGQIAQAAKDVSLQSYVNYVDAYQKQVQQANANAMPISFISNHDMDRAAGYLPVSTGRAYMAANLLLLSPGSPFIYYGEEIGLKGSRGGANTDANRRLAMLWGDGDTVQDPVGTTFDASKQTNGTVADHIAQNDSLMHRYTWLISLRNEYPEIARGSYNAVTSQNKSFAGFRVEYNGSTTGIFHNTSTAELVVDLAECGVSFTTLCEYIGSGYAKLEGSILTISPQSSVILK